MPNPATILIVDDVATNISILAHVLQPEFEVVFATSGAQALEIAARVSPDLVLLDVVMPEMDGYTVLSALKAEPATTAIPVILITGLQDDEAESRGMQSGAADYVTKPFNASVVRSLVRRYIG